MAIGVETTSALLMPQRSWNVVGVQIPDEWTDGDVERKTGSPLKPAVSIDLMPGATAPGPAAPAADPEACAHSQDEEVEAESSNDPPKPLATETELEPRQSDSRGPFLTTLPRMSPPRRHRLRKAFSSPQAQPPGLPISETPCGETPGLG